jgi:hypothetical protein
MAARIFGLSVLVILALSALGLWVIEGEHGSSAYLVVGVSLVIFTAVASFALASRKRVRDGVTEDVSSADDGLAEGSGRRGAWAQPVQDQKQEGDRHALDVENDPRGAAEPDAYGLGGPTDLIVEGETAMMGPGGAPQDHLEDTEPRSSSNGCSGIRDQ